MNRKFFKLDPRTKLFLILITALVVLSRWGGEDLHAFRMILTAVPFVLLPAEKEYSYCLKSLIGLLSSYCILYIPYVWNNSLVGTLAIVVGSILSRMIPTIAIAYYAVKTTKLSEFVAGMEKMHVSEKIIIPLTVVFRFLPTLKEEFQSIDDAMRMRGICFGGKKTSKVLEYKMIPMLICSVRIGEELSAAAITRGLASGIKRTNISKIGFGILDYAFLIFFAVTVVRLTMRFIGV